MSNTYHIMGKIKKTEHLYVFHCFPTLSKIFFLIFLVSTISQNEVNSQIPDPVAKTLASLEQTSFWSDTLRGLFELTDTYVDLISKNKFGPTLFKGLGIDVNNLTLSQLTNFQIPDFTNTTFLQATLTDLAKETAGYLANFLIGIVLFVALFVCAFALCCCRSKACFCGKTGKQEKKGSDKTVIGVMFIFILILTVIIFLDGFGLAVGTKVFTDNFKIQNETGNIQVVNSALTIIDNTVEYVKSLRNETIELLDKQNVTERVDKIIIEVKSSILETLIGTDGKFNSSLVNLLDSLNKLKVNLNQTSVVLTNLTTSYGNVKTSLTVIKDKAATALLDCANVGCAIPDGTFKKAIETRSMINLPDISDIQSQIDGILTGDLGKIIEQGPEGLIDDFTKQLGNISQLGDSLLSNLKEIIPTDLPISKELVTSNAMFTTVNQLLNQISPILSIVGPIIASFIFTSVVMNLVGLLLVICCGSSKPTFPEKIFVLSGSSSFPIGAIFALLAAILFIVTCPLYGEFCRDFSKGEKSTYFGIADNAIEKYLKEFIEGTNFSEGLNLKLNFSELNFIRSGLYGTCQNNQSLAKVLLRLATIDNDLTNSLVTQFVVPFIDSSFPNNTVFNVFRDETFQTLNDSIKSISSFNFTTFDAITNITVPVLIPTTSDLITQATNALKQGGEDVDIQKLIDTDIPEIDSFAKQILETESELGRQINSLKENIQGTESITVRMTDFLHNLKILRNNLESKGGLITAIKDSILTAIRSTAFDFVTGLIATLEKTFFCRPLFDFFSLFLSIPCDSLLKPLNAMWLTLGVFPILIIPSVGLGLFMGGLLVRQKPKNNDEDGMNEESDEEDKEEELEDEEESEREEDEEMVIKKKKKKEKQKKKKRKRSRNRNNEIVKKVKKSKTPDPIYPSNIPLPDPPSESNPPFSPTQNNQPTAVFPNFSVFPNAVYVDITKEQALNPKYGNNKQNKFYQSRQPFEQRSDINVYNYPPLNSPPPTYDPFTNYMKY